MTIGVHNEFDPAALKVVVHLLVMDHLTEEKNSLVRIFFDGFVADLDSVFHAVAKAKMARDVKLHRTEIQ